MVRGLTHDPSDRRNARIEHDKALGRVITALVNDDTQLYGAFHENESFRRWLAERVFGATYRPPSGGPPGGAPAAG